MAVAFDSIVNVTTGSTAANTGASPSITTPATNPVVFACVAIKDTTATVTSLTITGFGGTASEVKNQREVSASEDAYVSIWKIVAPTASTSGTVQANFSASVPYQMAVVTFSGADQTDPSPTADATSSGVDLDETLTPSNLTANDATLAVAGNTEFQDLDAPTPNNDYLSNTSSINLAVGHNLGTTSVTLGSNGGAGVPFAKVWVRVAASAAAATVDGPLIGGLHFSRIRRF